MTKTKQEKSAGAIIYCIEKEIKFLLLKYPTYWGFAKGIIEKDETEEQAAIREVKEETGLSEFEIIKQFQHKQKWFFKFQGQLVHKEAIFFLAKVSREDSDKVKISEEHENFSWLTYEEAMKEVKIKQNREMLSAAYNFIKEYEKQKKLIQ